MALSSGEIVLDPDHFKVFKEKVSELSRETRKLESCLERNSEPYRDINHRVVEALNQYPFRGVLNHVNVEKLKEHISGLVGFDIARMKKEEKDQRYSHFYLDLKYLGELKSNWKNPVILMLRRCQRYLNGPHQRLLKRLVDEYIIAGKIDFQSFSLEKSAETALEEMSFQMVNARFSGSVSRRLDMLSHALRLGVAERLKLRLLKTILDEKVHLHHQRAIAWLNASFYKDGRLTLDKAILKYRELLAHKSQEILKEIDLQIGSPVKQNLDELDIDFSWYSLGMSLARGEAFVETFGKDVKSKISRLEYRKIHTFIDAAKFKDSAGELLLSKKPECEKISELFFQLETCIEESTGRDSRVATAIAAETSQGCMTSSERKDAEAWVQENRVELMELKLNLFNGLVQKSKLPDSPPLAEYLEKLIEKSGSPDPSLPKPERFHERLRNISQNSGPLTLEPLTILHKEILLEIERLACPNFLNGYLQKTDLKSEDGKENQNVILQKKFHQVSGILVKVGDQLEQIRLQCEELVRHVYRESRFCIKPVEEGSMPLEEWDGPTWISHEVFDYAHALVLDEILLKIVKLDYTLIQEASFRRFFEELPANHQAGLFHLDRLFHELRNIPLAKDLLAALENWAESIGPDYDIKRKFIETNDEKLQTLLSEVRAELREILSEGVEVVPKRIYFEVFGMPDLYAENLHGLLKGLLRTAPKLTSIKSGHQLISDIEAVESRILEAQGSCWGEGETLKKMASLHEELLSQELCKSLEVLVKENLEDLKKLLKEINQGLKRVMTLQNKFGANFDMSHLAHVIDIMDLVTLKNTYHFAPNTAMMDIKRFAMSYRRRDHLINDLLKAGLKNDKFCPKEVAKMVSKSVHEQYLQKKKLSLDLKLNILLHHEAALNAEAELLKYTLNFVDPEHLGKKAIIHNVLELLKGSAGRTTSSLGVSECWSFFRNTLDDYDPKNARDNYRANKKDFLQNAARARRTNKT